MRVALPRSGGCVPDVGSVNRSTSRATVDCRSRIRPTSASVSPCASENVTPSTARTAPPPPNRPATKREALGQPDRPRAPRSSRAPDVPRRSRLRMPAATRCDGASRRRTAPRARFGCRCATRREGAAGRPAVGAGTVPLDLGQADRPLRRLPAGTAADRAHQAARSRDGRHCSNSDTTSVCSTILPA